MERHWEDAAASLTTGMVLHVCYEAALEGRIACLADLAHVFTRPGCNFRDTLSELLNFPHDPGYPHQWRMPTGELTATHPVVKEKVQEMLDKEDKEFRASSRLRRRRSRYTAIRSSRGTLRPATSRFPIW